MKKKIRLLAVCAIMLCGMIVGGIAKPAEVMAKQTIKATREMKDAPKIQLDKLYHIAAMIHHRQGRRIFWHGTAMSGIIMILLL